MPSTKPPGRCSTTSRIDWARPGTSCTRAERERAGLHARKDALELGLSRADGPAALVATAGDLPGLLGSVAALLSVQTGYEAPVSAALGAAADAVAVSQTDAAVDAIARLRAEDRGRAGILVAGRVREEGEEREEREEREETAWPELPPGAVYAVDVVDGPPQLRAALRQLMSKVAVVGGLDDAQALVNERADVVAVTRDGDLLGRHFAMGGSSAVPSLIEVQAAVDEATRRLDASTHACERLRFELSRLTEERESAQRSVDVWLAKLHESDAAMTAVAEELGQLGALARAAGGEADRLLEAISEAEEVHRRDLAGLGDLERRLAAATRRLRRGAGIRRAGAPHPGGPGRPAGRDGGSTRPAYRRGARECAERAGRRAAAVGAGRTARPGRRDGPSTPARP